MPKQNKHRGPIWALLLLLQILFLESNRIILANTIVQPSGSSCTAKETTSIQAPLQLPEIKLNPNNSIQLASNAAGQSSSASPQQQQQIQRQLDSARQVAFETICDGWENSISSRAFWLLDESRRALIAKFVYQDKTHHYDHPEARITSPIFPSIPLLHSMEESRYFESCRLQFRIYSTIASQIEVLMAPIQTVAAGSAQMLAAPSSQPIVVDSYVIDFARSTRNRIAADKQGEASVWQQREIIMPKSPPPPSESQPGSNSNRSIPAQPSPLPYKIEFSAVPTRLTSAETQSPGYLVGIALANITLSPECFGLNIDKEELAKVSYFEQQQHQSPPTQRSSSLSFDRIVHEHRLFLVLIVIGVLVFVTLIIVIEHVYCASRRSNKNRCYNNNNNNNNGNKRRMVTQRQRVYASDIKPTFSNSNHQTNSRCQRRDEMMQKHQLHPLSLSLVENVQLRENPNYASLAHEIEQEQGQGQQQQTTDYIVRYEPDEWEIDISKVILGQQVGTGAFGMVYSGQLIGHDGSKHQCAIKTLPTTATLKQRMDFLREASIMKQFNTQHVVKLLGVVSRANPVYVIMELMEFGDLKSHLRSVREVHHREGKTLVEGVYLMVAQIADGMAYLASKKFVHRDLAARNCMVGENRVVKIGDFGLTRDIYVNDYYRRDDTHGRLPVRWMAPESLLDNIYTSASDVWSFGIVVWEIVTFAAYPYQGQSNDEVIKHVSAGFTMTRPDSCPSKLFNIMQRCWLREPNERPRFCDLVVELMPETEGKFYPSKAPIADERTAHESYHQMMISDDRKPLVALYPVVH